jgi:hypothetical protein
MNDLTDQLTALFQETGRAHHQAYIATDGRDEEWPMWYADYLGERLSDLLGVNFTKSEVVYLMVLLNRDQTEKAPREDWTQYYARYFAQRYGK